MDQTGNNYMNKRQLDMVTVLRLLAFLCIFLLHEKIFAPVDWSDGMKHPWILFTPAWAGTWIFFFLNGYGLGFGLKNEKYELSFNGISKFYISRLCAIVPLYWFYIILVSVFITPEVWNLNGENICKLLNLFLFNYQEEYYSLEFGLAWYLTTMLRLALFAPAIFYLIRRIEKRVKNSFTLFIIAVVMGGLLLRVLALLCVIKYGGDWSRQVYKPFYFNFDLFITGIAVHYLPSGSFLNKSKIKFVRFAVILAFLAMIEVSSYLYFYGEKYGILRYRYSYVCFFPTIFLLLCIAFVYFFQNNSISLPSV